MLQAQLHRKVSRKQERLEDILTSNVFGSIKYAQIERGLIPILRLAEEDDGNAPFRSSLFEGAKAKYQFWPKLHEDNCSPCEPDVLITITRRNDKPLIVLVEAKYFGVVSSEAYGGPIPTHQLAKEWENLVSISKAKNADSLILYVTSHFIYPESDVESAREELLELRGKEELKVVWLSWRRIPDLFMHSALEMLRDVANIVSLQNLIYFNSFTLHELRNLEWSITTTLLNVNPLQQLSWNIT